MSAKLNFKKIGIVIFLSMLLLLLVPACNLSPKSTLPATPTMVELEIPILEAEENGDTTEDMDEDITEEEPVVEEEQEAANSLTETPMPQPTATPEPEEAEDTAATEEVAEVLATPTLIPFVTTSNPDPMVLIYGATNCYASSDTESDVLGVASAGTALGAFKRDWNWYQVVHPTKGGLVCWVTGDSIRPNQSAYKLNP